MNVQISKMLFILGINYILLWFASIIIGSNFRNKVLKLQIEVGWGLASTYDPFQIPRFQTWQYLSPISSRSSIPGIMPKFNSQLPLFCTHFWYRGIVIRTVGEGSKKKRSWIFGYRNFKHADILPSIRSNFLSNITIFSGSSI